MIRHKVAKPKDWTMLSVTVNLVSFHKIRDHIALTLQRKNISSLGGYCMYDY